MQCLCQRPSNDNNATLTLCDLHAREFHRRVEDMRGPDDKAIWNAALDAVERVLVISNNSPIDIWIVQRIGLLRK